MVQKANDFMIEEYKLIAQAFFNLHTQKNRLLRYYFTLMTISATLSGAIIEALPILFPTETITLDSTILGIPILILAIIGVLILNSIIGVRHDMLMYARTVNEVRGYFVTLDKKIKSHLVLPTDASKPNFFENPLKYFFWEVALVGVVNSSLFIFALILLNYISLKVWILFLGLLFVLCQIGFYSLLSFLREREFKE